MKKRTPYLTHTLRVSLMFIAAILLYSCNDEDNSLTKVASTEEVKLHQIYSTGRSSDNERSSPSTKVIAGIDWYGTGTGNYPYLDHFNPSTGAGGGYSFGNTIPKGSKNAGSVVGDFNGDGIDELIVAYNSTLGSTLVKVTGPVMPGTSTIFFSGPASWKFAGVAAVDFNNDGIDELITAVNTSTGPFLYKGDATSLGASIYAGPSTLKLLAVAGGNFNGNGNEELITGLRTANGPTLYRSQGSNIGTLFYSAPSTLFLGGLTAADFDNSGSDELITGMNSAQGPSLHKGNATSLGSQIFQGAATESLEALTSGKFGSVCTMHVGFMNKTTGSTIYAHDGTNMLGLVRSYFSDPNYRIVSLASGMFQ